MSRNFFKTGLRNITRHKGFSFINIAGLTLGLTSCLLIGLFVRDEKQYDRFVPGAADIYRVYQKAESDVSNIIATAPPVFATALKQNFPEAEQTLRVMALNSKELFQANGKQLYEENGFIADSNFFQFFPLHFKYGSPEKVLDGPNSIVISAVMAEKFFGSGNPVGKTILMDKDPFVIKGVLRNDEKFHLPVNFLYSLGAVAFPPEMMQSWQWYPFNTYVKLKAGTPVQATEAKFQTYSKPFLKGEGGSNVPFFQPLGQVHLYSSDFKYDISVRGNISYVNALTIIALFILVIACFNFVNLATSRSLQRAKEVGVRKTIGAGRRQLLFQFIGETVLLAAISMVLAIVAAWLLLPSLNRFTEKEMVFDIFTNPLIALSVVALILLVGILAGFYPAL
ncbi:MAG TPA: ABC transporter permease, partial [Chitinophagaceae bacterium]|nr:ABC transporter permease [Chitinophagaceae bacterium]